MVLINVVGFPFPLKGKSFNELSEDEERYFCDWDEYFLPYNHAVQIVLLNEKSFVCVRDLAFKRLWRDSVSGLIRFPIEKRKSLHDKWNSESGLQDVRQWLYDLGISFSRNVFLLYPEQVIYTPWKLLVRYWNGFAWSVGMGMYAFDASMNWVCEFHHEDVIIYSTFTKV